MEIYNSYSIRKVCSMLEYENRITEILHLNNMITEYISDTRKIVTDALEQLSNGTRTDVMNLWRHQAILWFNVRNIESR